MGDVFHQAVFWVEFFPGRAEEHGVILVVTEGKEKEKNKKAQAENNNDNKKSLIFISKL